MPNCNRRPYNRARPCSGVDAYGTEPFSASDGADLVKDQLNHITSQGGV
jgi:hypothetical protein